MIASFGQDRSLVDRRFPPIWSLLHAAGVSVGVCGSLHTYPAPDDLDSGQAADMAERLAGHVDATPGAQLWIASSMGQRATMAQSLETQLYLTDPARFLQVMGLPSEGSWQRRPAMLPQFNLVVETEYVEAFREALETVRVGGQPLTFKASDNGFFSLDFGQANLHDQPDAVTIADEARSMASLGVKTVEIEDRSDTTAYHVPEGVLAVYDPLRPPAANGARPEVSVVEVAPTLLQILGVEPPPYMAQPKMLAELLPA
jgi:hypothetical protein